MKENRKMGAVTPSCMLALLFLFGNSFVYAQHKRMSYEPAHYADVTIEFDGMKTVIASSPHKHMGSRFTTYGSYSVNEDTIFIKMLEINIFDIYEAKKYGMDFLSNKKITLIKNKRALIDYENKRVYLPSKITQSKWFKRRHLVLKNGVLKTQKGTLIDGHGIVQRMAPKKFEKWAKKIYENPNEYNLSHLGSVEGYLKYGYLGAKGVFVVNKNVPRSRHAK